MVTYLPRSAWGARAAKGSTALVPSEVLNTAFHWPGMKDPIDAAGDIGKRRVASALRGWQAYHMDSRGWSDIAYQIAIDQAGRAWTLRGINIRSGANGDGTVNRKYGAILLVLAPGEKMSAAMKATARAVVADYRKRFPKMPVKPTTHSAVRPAGTTCPGPIAEAAIKAGELNAATAPVTSPAPTDPPASPEDDMPYTPEQLKHFAGQGVHGQKIGRTDTTFALAVEGAYKNSAAAVAAITSVGAAVVALGNRITSEDAADDAEFRAAMAKLDATLTELKAAVETPEAPEPPKA